MSGSSLKVGLVLDDGLDSPDGVQQYVLAIGEWLTSQGHEVSYLVGNTTRSDIPNVYSLSRNLRVKSNGNYLTIPLPTSKRKLKKFLDEHQFDVLHVQTPYSPMMGGRLIKLANPKTAVIGTFHILPNSAFISISTRLLGAWCRRSLKRFDQMLSVSPAAASFALDKFKVESDVLPNVIDYPRFNRAKPIDKYKDSVLNILFLGRLVPRKGCMLLLQAVSRLRSAGVPKFRVIICGKGPLLDELTKYVNDNQLSDIVEFVGFVSEQDKPSYYASADISVFPSSGGESFGIVLLEAMASGRAAVLAGNNPGYSSVLHERSDLLFDAKDSDALANKLAEFMREESLRKQAADWGSHYTESFDVSVVGQKLVEIYKAALLKRGNL